MKTKITFHIKNELLEKIKARVDENNKKYRSSDFPYADMFSIEDEIENLLSFAINFHNKHST